ncbi:MAG TPA: GNAT family N-acetyltransferase [Candidatus Acidoferrales bacterium]|nr:GNAT family N-acetyltransferase [Candidatus Acidoferrales bacterium]
MPEHHSQGREALLVLHGRSRAAGDELSDRELPDVHAARLDELTPRALLGILAVRQDVFVVEQNCVYPDIDASDADAETRHLWIEGADGVVVSTLRLLQEAGGGHRIGRVATHAAARGRGYSSALMRRAIELAGPPIVLSAQAYLVEWYGTFGFVEHGERWIEDGIEHAPMRLDVRR